VPKSVKASALSADLASKLAANGLLDLDPATEDLLAKRAEQEEQEKYKQAAKMRDQLETAIAKLDRQQDDINQLKRRGYDDGMDTMSR